MAKGGRLIIDVRREYIIWISVKIDSLGQPMVIGLIDPLAIGCFFFANSNRYHSYIGTGRIKNNVNKGCNAILVERSEILGGYVHFTDKIKGYVAAGYDRAEAFTKAIQECRDEGVLASYLKQNGSEVLKIETACHMLADGLNPEVISKYTRLPMGKIKSLKPLAPESAAQFPRF